MRKEIFLRLLVAGFFIGILIMLSGELRATSAPSPGTKGFMPGELLVKFKTIHASKRLSKVASLGGAIHATLSDGLVHIKLDAGQTVETALAAYRNDPDVEYAQPNYIYHASLAPNDPQYSQQWAFKNTGQIISPVPGTNTAYAPNNPGTPGNDLNIEPAWNILTDCSSVVVAVIDSGVNYNNQDLVSNMWTTAFNPLHGANFTNEGLFNDPMDLYGHGTHVAGIIGGAGNNSLGVTGVCWKANIMAVRVLDSTGTGPTAKIIQGINFAVTNGAKIINMSLGGGGAFDQAYSDAITTAQTADVVVIVSAGNNSSNNDTSPSYPCNFTPSNLLCVAALDQSYALATFSNYGATSVHVGAPGTNILSTYAGSKAPIVDPLTTGWSGNSTTGTGFAYGSASTPRGVLNALNDPGVASWPLGTYAANTTDTIWKNFDLSAVNAATLQIYSSAHVTSDGSAAVADSFSGGNPFLPASPVYVVQPFSTDGTTPATTPIFTSNTLSVTNCLSVTCTIGIQLKTGATLDLGVSVASFQINTLTLNTNSYETLDGTSMASPEVAGLATMLRAYNPNYTYADVVSAIKNAGRPTASLAGRTTTGNAIDVMRSLAYINPPTGLKATVQ